MKFRKVAILMLMFALVNFCLLVPRASALTNEEIIRLIDERFAKGEISEDNYNRLRKKYGDTDTVSTKPVEEKKTVPAKKAAGNLVKNASFEEDANNDNTPDQWQIFKWGSQTRRTVVDSSVAHSGQSSARVEAPAEFVPGAGFIQPIAVTPGKKYLLSGWCKSGNLKRKNPAGEGGALSVEFNNGGGHLFIDLKMLRENTDWVKVSKVITVPAVSDIGTVRALAFDFKGIIWFDDISLVEME